MKGQPPLLPQHGVPTETVLVEGNDIGDGSHLSQYPSTASGLFAPTTISPLHIQTTALTNYAQAHPTHDMHQLSYNNDYQQRQHIPSTNGRYGNPRLVNQQTQQWQSFASPDYLSSATPVGMITPSSTVGSQGYSAGVSPHSLQPHQHAHIVQQQPPPQMPPSLPPSQIFKKPDQADTNQQQQVVEIGAAEHGGYNLGFIRECLDLIELYREYSGTVSPLHPSILDEDNIRYVVATPAGAAERSSLTCGVYLALSLGAWQAGNKRLSDECHNRGQAILSQLLTDTYLMHDYSLAMNLVGYGRYALLFSMDDTKSWNYFQLAMTVCRNIGALNSDIYGRCLYKLNCHERASAEDLESFRVEIGRVRQLPYYLFPMLSEAAAATGKPRKGYPWMRSAQNAALQKELYGVTANILNAYKICRNSLLRCATETERSLIVPHMLEVLNMLEKCKSQIERAFEDARAHNDPPPHSPIVTFAMFYLGLKSEIYHQLHMDAPALQWAMEFAHYLQENIAFSSYYLVSMPIYFEWIMQIFSDLGKHDVLHSFIDFLNGFQPILCPMLARSIAHFTQQQQQQPSYTLPGAEILGSSRAAMQQQQSRSRSGAQRKNTAAAQKIDAASTKRKRQLAQKMPQLKVKAETKPESTQLTLSTDCGGVAAKEVEQKGGYIFVGEGGVKRARKRRRRQKEIGEIWGSNASRHCVLSECRSYMSVFRKHLWHFAPVHPAVLDESNIQYFVLGDGSREISTLSLSMLLCLSRGAVTTGNMKAASEFFKRAEQQMEALLRMPSARSDYALALAAACMVWLYPILQDDRAVEKARYYASLGLSICESLGVLNCDAYSRGLLGLCMVVELPLMLKDGDTSNAESLVLGKFARMQQSPYCAITSVTPNVFTIAPSPEEDIDPYEATKRCRTFAGLQLQMPVSTRNLSTLNTAFGMVSDMLANFRVARSKKDLAGLERTTATIEELRKMLKELKAEQRQASDEWPDSVYRFLRLLCVVADAVCYVCRGLNANAEQYALKFVDMIEKPTYQALMVGIYLLMQAMVDVLCVLKMPMLLVRELRAIELRTPTPQLDHLKALIQQHLDESGLNNSSTTATEGESACAVAEELSNIGSGLDEAYEDGLLLEEALQLAAASDELLL